MAKRKKQPKRVRAQAANMGRRRRKRRSKWVWFYSFLLFCLLAIGAVYFFTECMKIESIDVAGVEKYTPDEVIAASGIALGDNLLGVNKTAVQQELLEQFPYIRTVAVRGRYWPPRVEIAVEQAKPVGAILQDDEVVFIDDEGKVLERGVLLIPETMLLIKGVDAQGAMPGDLLGAYTAPQLEKDQEMPAEELEKKAQASGVRERLVMFRYLLDAMEQSGFTQLTNVDLTDRLNMRVNYENRITLELGSESQLVDKLRTAQYILQTDIDPDESGTLDVTEIHRDRARFDPVPHRRYHAGAEDQQPAPQPQPADPQPEQTPEA